MHSPAMDDLFGFYLVAYVLFALCIAIPPTEFVSAGLTLEYLCKGLLGVEQNAFIAYHLKRTSLTLVVHASLPLGFFVCLQLIDGSAYSTFFAGFGSLSLVWRAVVVTSLLLPLVAGAVVVRWRLGDWKRHPIVRTLRFYDDDWHQVASRVDAEYCRFDKVQYGVPVCN